MADLSRSSYLAEDPLHALSGLSLFPRTLESLSISLPPNYQSDNLQQTHTLLESMPFEVQKEHLEQAKAILDDSSEILEEGSGTSVAAEAPNMNPIPNKRERRPGLDRKRGHFSFKPTISQPPQNKPTFDPKKYPNPEDYFAAYDRYEIALRQWEKYTGTSVTDTNQNQPSRRPRGPGLPGRKRGSFVLTYTDSYKTALNLKASKKENPIPSEQSLERTTAAHVTTADREADDSTMYTDKNLKFFLTEMLARNPDELEGDGAGKLLEQYFQIKDVDLGNFTLPEAPDVKMNWKTSVSSQSNRRTALSDIQNQNLLKGINRVAARKNSQSPSSNPSEDQFSFHDSQYLLPKDRQPSEVDPSKDLNTCYRSSVTNDADKVITNDSLSNVGTLHVADPFKSSGQTSSCEDTSDTRSSPDGNADNCVDDSITSKNSATPEVNVEIQTEENEVDVSMSESDANRNAGRSINDDDINEETDQLDSLAEDASREVARKDPLIVEEDSIPYQQGESSKSANRVPEQYDTMGGSFEHAEHIQDQDGEENDNTDTASELEVENAQEEVHNSSYEKKNKRKTRESGDNKRGKRSKTTHDESELMKTLPHEGGAKKQTKTKSSGREEKKQTKKVTREGKIFASRKSLAGAGTKWESGTRKSTRIKSRPLEYWRGERFLYARIHESVASVIGIKKFESPGKDDGELKVKSFVSDEYKKLVDIAAQW